jgi:integrase
MAKRRTAGEGTINQLPSGSWRAQVSLKGRRLSHTSKTQQAAREWLRKIHDQIDQGLTYDDERITLGVFMEGWLATKKNQVRLSTGRLYSNMCHAYIQPRFGALRLKNLTPAMIQEFYDELARQGKGIKSIRVLHAVLRLCLEQARKLGMIPNNPTNLCKVPYGKKKEMKFWDEDQIIQFLKFINGHKNENLYYLALTTGMRRGELLGLKWKDLDWLKQRLMVQRQCFHPTGGGFVFQEPKTKTGIRNIRLGIGGIEHLRAQLKNIDIMRSISKSKWQENDLIFPSLVGTPQGANNLSMEFNLLVKRSGLSHIRFHDCRHTAASIMLAHGIPASIVAEILGHSMSTLLNNYAHFLPNKQDEAARLMDELTRPIPIEILRGKI